MLLLRLLLESFSMAFHALVVNKLRTLLSLLGITFGIFAIISVFTIVDSLEANVRKSIQSLGDNVIYIEKWPWAFSSDYPWWKYMNRPSTGYMEMEFVKKRAQSAEAVAMTVNAEQTLVKYGNNSIENTNIICASFEFDRIKAFELQEGRYFSQRENDEGRNLALIGSDIHAELFNNVSPLGKVIDIKNAKMTVIGVFQKEGTSMIGGSMDNVILIPLNSARKFINVRRERFNPRIMVKTAAGVSNEEMKDELKGVMRSVRRQHPYDDDNFALNESKMISAGVDGLFQAIGMAGWIIGGFAILVGGFGIANIMFVSVKERTNIIGIQKSLGAKRFFILSQFLAESVALCLIGGGIGLLLIFAGTLGVNAAFDAGIYLTLSNVVLGLSVSAIIGIIAGFVPAWSASIMDPVEAIRTK